MTRKPISRITSLLAAVALAACGGSSSDPAGPRPPGPVSGAHSSLAASPAEVVADGVAAATLTAVARDAAGTPVPNVSIEFSAAGGTLGAASATTGADGSASTTLTSTVAGEVAVTATADAETLGTAQAVTFTAGPAASLAITASPVDPVTAGDLFGATVELRDAFGNLVTSGLEQISLALQGGNPAAVLGGTTSAPTVLGAASFADLDVELAGEYRLVASATGLADAISPELLRVVAAAADPATSAVAASPATQVAGDEVVLTATILDFFGNPVEGEAVTFVTTAAGATFLQPPSTDPSGIATGSVTSTLAGALTVRGSIGAGAELGGTATVTFEPGAPSDAESTLVATPGAVDADGTSAIALVVTVKDEFGNAIPGAIVTLSSSGDASFVQPGPTDASGVATGAVTSTAVGPQDVAAAVGAVTVAGTGVVFLTLDPDGDGIPKGEDAFPDDPNRFAVYATVALPGLGGTFAAATAVNAGNVVVGLSEDGTGLLTGARWTVSGTSATPGVQLQPLPGNAYSAAYAVDASGTAVGESERGAEYVPVLWGPGASIPIDLRLGGFASPGAAYGVSGGRIVGEATQGAGSAALLWSDVDATPVQLASLGGDRSAAYAIAGSFVVGESTLAGPAGASVGAIWTLDASGNPGAPVALAPLAGHVSSVALAVDAAGRVVGESESATGQVHAVSWTVAAPGAPVDLGTGSAQGVNAGGRVAGYAGLPVGPMVWDVRNPGLAEGVLEDPFLFSQAYGLNGANVVVGVLDGGAFAAVPVAP
jgi:adhesin/invasin